MTSVKDATFAIHEVIQWPVPCAKHRQHVHSVPYQNMCVLKMHEHHEHANKASRVHNIHIYRDIHTYIWVNCNDLTATSLESWLIREIIPRMALIQVSEIFSFTQIHGHRP